MDKKVIVEITSPLYYFHFNHNVLAIGLNLSAYFLHIIQRTMNKTCNAATISHKTYPFVASRPNDGNNATKKA